MFLGTKKQWLSSPFNFWAISVLMMNKTYPKRSMWVLGTTINSYGYIYILRTLDFLSLQKAMIGNMILKQSVLDKTRTHVSDPKPLRMCVKGDYLYEGIKLH